MPDVRTFTQLAAIKYGKLETVLQEPETVALIKPEYAEYYCKDGWTVVGEAVVTVTFRDKSVVLADQVTTLRAKLASVRAKHQQEQQELEQQINNLLALPFDEGTTGGDVVGDADEHA